MKTFAQFRTAEQARRRRYWRALLKACEGSVAATALAAGVNRTYLYAVLKRYGLTGNGQLGRPPARRGYRRGHRGNEAWHELGE